MQEPAGFAGFWGLRLDWARRADSRILMAPGSTLLTVFAIEPADSPDRPSVTDSQVIESRLMSALNFTGTLS